MTILDANGAPMRQGGLALTPELFHNGGNIELFDSSGSKFMLTLTPSDVSYEEEIPSLLARFKNGDALADQVSPPMLVDKDTDKYRTFSEDDTFLLVPVKGSIQGSIPEIDPSSSTAQYTVVDRFVGSFINPITVQNANAYDPRAAAARRCMTAIEMDREVDVWTQLTSTGAGEGWTDAGFYTTLVAGTAWAIDATGEPGANSDPIKDLETRMKASYTPVTDVWMNFRSAIAFLKHPLVKDYLKQYRGDSPVEAPMAQIQQGQVGQARTFTMPGIFAGVTFHVTSMKYKATSAATPDYILGNHVVLTTAANDPEMVHTNRTFRRRGSAGVGFETREFRIENRGPRGGTMLVVFEASIPKMRSVKAGGLIKSVVQ